MMLLIYRTGKDDLTHACLIMLLIYQTGKDDLKHICLMMLPIYRTGKNDVKHNFSHDSHLSNWERLLEARFSHDFAHLSN